MRKLLPALFLGAVVGGCRDGRGDGADSGPLESVEITRAGLEDATRAMTDLGPRMVGTQAEQQAAAEIEARMLAAGLDAVAAEPFTWDAWVPGGATLTIDDEAWEGVPLSPSPPTAGLTLPLAVAADGDPVEGTAAVYSSSDGSRAEQFVWALTSGADALIRVTEDAAADGTPLVEAGHTLVGSALPCVGVDKDTGDALRAAAAAGGTVTVDIDAETIEDLVSLNIVGQVTGTTDAEPVYVLAHYDSWHQSESAFDNALGVGMLLVLAQRAASLPAPERTVVFVATSAEEQGLQGAQALVDALGDRAADATAALTLDVPWSAAGTYWAMASTDTLLDLAVTAAEDQGLDAFDGGLPSPASDHFPFQARGVDAVWLTRQPDPHYHTTHDTLAALDLDAATRAAAANWAVLAGLAGFAD